VVIAGEATGFGMNWIMNPVVKAMVVTW
jgi:hypothetical protein